MAFGTSSMTMRAAVRNLITRNPLLLRPPTANHGFDAIARMVGERYHEAPIRPLGGVACFYGAHPQFQ